MLFRLFLFCLMISVATTFATGNDSLICKEVRLSDIGWTDIAATTAVATELLRALDYEPTVSILSLQVTLTGLKNNDLDIFLGNWMPAQESEIRPYLLQNSLVQMQKNLEHGRYTMAVPDYVYEAGVHSFSDLHNFENKFLKRIYGIEPGNDGNNKVLKMIQQNAFSLSKWSLVESSEQGMLAEVKQAVANNEYIVFLGWEPHPMNTAIKMRYLSGGDAFFGAKMGESTVYTLSRYNFANDCPNLTQFFNQLIFSVDIENQLMRYILDFHMTPQQAAQKWLAENKKIGLEWIKNVQTFSGSSGAESFDKYVAATIRSGEKQKFYKIPIGDFVSSCIDYLTTHFSPQFRTFSVWLETAVGNTVEALLDIPAAILIFLFCCLVFLLHRSFALCFLVLVGCLLIVNLDLWKETIQTLVLVLMAAFYSAAVGVPIGILASRYDKFYKILRPMLDLMQTIPTFVYLIPTLMLFGLGIVPGLISTVVFAIPAPIRMTYLGLKAVPVSLIEVTRAFGATPWQTLVKVEIPSAMPSIRAGFTQCIMLSLSMVVVAALVGAEGLGSPVIRALNTVDITRGFESGLAIVILAVLLDRVLNKSQLKNELGSKV